ncbi:MAG: serine/threonine dehydratase [Rickettsiales bacterium]|nr:serine/threonine dehydratase [Rickettsiales bacterium]
MLKELTLSAITNARERLGERVVTTPSLQWQGAELSKYLGSDTAVFVKLELFQRTGTFKARGAMNAMLQLTDKQLKRGVTAVSAGNHAIAAAYCAHELGTNAKIFMPKTAKPLRIARAMAYNPDIVFCDTQSEMFDLAERAKTEEGRTFVHPFEGPMTVQGTATAGLEFAQQVPELHAMILPIGGGGLCAGFSAALKQVWPNVAIFGVEPEGANTMSLSFANGAPIRKEDVSTIADSLAPPLALPYTYSICRDLLEDIVLVSDEALRQAMRTLFYDLKLAVEPAGAATAAALFGPLKDRLAGKRVGVITCGANIDLADFCELTAE